MHKLSVNRALAKATTHAKRGQIEQAKELYTSILKAYPNNKQAKQELANIYGALNIEAEQSLIEEKNSAPDKNTIGERFKNPSSLGYEDLEYADFFRPGMGTENLGGLLRSMVQMLRPKRILEIGAGYSTPFLLEALVNNLVVLDEGNLEPAYFENYRHDPKLVIIEDQSLGELFQSPGMREVAESNYVDIVQGKFQGLARRLEEDYGKFDFVWFDCGGRKEYEDFLQEYWDLCSDFVLFHFTYYEGRPNKLFFVIQNFLDELSKNGERHFRLDIVEPHKRRQGSVTIVKKLPNNL